MFFKSEKTARDVRLNPLGLPAKFHVDRAHRVEVTLRLPSPEEQTQGFKTDDAQCEATMQFDPSDKIAVALQDLAGSRLPEGSKEPEEWRREHDYIDQTGHIRDNYVAPWGVLPEGLQAFLRQTFAELRSALSVTVGALRWRLGDDGLHQPFASRGNSYSLDGEAWVRAPTETFVHVSTRGDLRITGTVAADVQQLLDQREEEPLGHAIWRESWGERHENPRSSLVLGISALEVGVKQFISTRVPDAAWLLEEVPSPPVSRMLAEYLPGLPAGEGGPLDTPDREAVETIKKGVHLRNKVAHTGHATYTPETLETILLAVRDVLWGLDSNRGLAWIEDLRTARRF